MCIRDSVYAHFILGMSQTEIAKAEGVSKMAVSYSIERALKSMEKFLKNLENLEVYL